MKNSKSQPNAKRDLHLVQAEEPSASSQQETQAFIGQGVMRYQELQAEMDRALFAKPQDVETLAVVMPKLLRERLATYGVRLR